MNKWLAIHVGTKEPELEEIKADRALRTNEHKVLLFLSFDPLISEVLHRHAHSRIFACEVHSLQGLAMAPP